MILVSFNRLFRKYFLLRVSLLSFIIFSCMSKHVYAELKLVATTKPLAMLASALLADIPVEEGSHQVFGVIPFLFSPNIDAHHSHLRINERLRLQQATFIFWNGDCFEPSVAKILDLDKSLNLAASRCQKGDIHWWLNPQSSQRVVRSLVEALLPLLAAQPAQKLLENQRQLLSQLNEFDMQTKQRFARYHDKHLMFYHDSYPELTQHYELPAASVIYPYEHKTLSTKHWQQLHKLVAEQQVDCVYREPQFSGKAIERLVMNTSTPVGVFDPLGTDITLDKESYLNFQRQLVDGIIHCFDDH